MIRRPPRSTPFPTRRSSDLTDPAGNSSTSNAIAVIVDNTAPNAGTLSFSRSEEHTSELQSQFHLVCRLLLEKKKNRYTKIGTRNSAVYAMYTRERSDRPSVY